MKRYFARRLVQLVPLFIIITFITFGLMYLAPGGPEAIFLAGEDPTLDPAQIEKLKEKWGLNDPFHVQYLRWLGNVLRGDLGRSFMSQRPVTETILQRIPATIQLNVVTIVLVYGLAIPIGVLSAVRQYSVLDYVATTFSFLGQGMPNFWVGLMLIFLVALPSKGLIPTHGYADPYVTLETHSVFAVLLDRARYMLLPTITLVTGALAGLIRYMRNSMLEVLKEDYVRTARAKGLSEKIVIYKHALRNALLPIITLSAGLFNALIGGSVLTETIFAWPGLGKYAIDAINAQDHPVVLAFLLFGFIAGTIGSFTAEALYVLVDPRIRYS